MKQLIAIAFALTLLFSKSSHAYCFEEAAQRYGVSAALLWAIAKIESGLNTSLPPKAQGGVNHARNQSTERIGKKASRQC